MNKKILIIGGRSGIGLKISNNYGQNNFVMSVSKSGFSSNQLLNYPSNLENGVNFLIENDVEIFFNKLKNLNLLFDYVIITAGKYTPIVKIQQISTKKFLEDSTQNIKINLNVLKNVHKITSLNSSIVIFLGGGVGENLSSEISSTYILSKLSLIAFIEHFPHNLINRHIIGISPGFFNTGFSKPKEDFYFLNQNEEINYKKLFSCLDTIFLNPNKFCGRTISAQNDSPDLLDQLDITKMPSFGKFRRVFN